MIIDTPEGIEAYRKLALYHALKLEVATGMRHSRGSIRDKICKEFGLKPRSKRKVLADYEAILRAGGYLR